MRLRNIINPLVFAIIAILFTTPVNAALTSYSDWASFNAALPTGSQTLDFDSLSYGTIISDGESVDGITFSYNFGGIQIMVSDIFDTTSSPNFLGTNDGDILQDGDNLSISFAASNSVGMYFITADEMYDNDIIISTKSGSAGLVASEYLALIDGSKAFFVGLIDDTGSFTSADISTIGGGYFLYNLDDITISPVPIPGAFSLMFSALFGVFCIKKKLK